MLLLFLQKGNTALHYAAAAGIKKFVEVCIYLG